MTLVDWNVTQARAEDETENIEKKKLESNEGKELREDVGEDDENLREERKDAQSVNEIEIEKEHG